MATKNRKAETTTKNVKPAPAPTASTTATLTLVRVRPNGSAVYGIAGVPGTVRVAKGLLTGEAPATLVVNSGAFRAPNPERAAKLAARGARQAKAQASLEERVAKAQAQLAKAAERAAKAEARAAKLVAKLAKVPKANGAETAQA